MKLKRVSKNEEKILAYLRLEEKNTDYNGSDSYAVALLEKFKKVVEKL
ncbi:MAG: hypothetical protein KMY55_16805 [Dethiosulfatibacter sp.]|nr:hypothetical protein [Dethiosulfatibacter sp.]